MAEKTNGPAAAPEFPARTGPGFTQGPEWDLMTTADRLGAIIDTEETVLTLLRGHGGLLRALSMEVEGLRLHMDALRREMQGLRDRLLSDSIIGNDQARRAPAAAPVAGPAAVQAPDPLLPVAKDLYVILLSLRPEAGMRELAGQAVQCALYLREQVKLAQEDGRAGPATF